jgi:hypothetical protein
MLVSSESLGRSSVEGAKNISTENVAPLPSSLWMEICAPMMSQSCLVMVSPRPVPPKRRVVEPSACTNGSKMFLANT